MRQRACFPTSISEMHKNFGKLCKICSFSLIGRDSRGLWLKKNQFEWHKGHESYKRTGATTLKYQIGKKFFCDTAYKKSMIFFTRATKVSANQICWTFFAQLYKILTHFRDRGGRVCFLVHPVFSLITVACQNNFHKNFRFKMTFTEICNMKYVPIWNFKVASIYTPKGPEDHIYT